MWCIRYDRPGAPHTGQRRQTTRRGFTSKREADRALRDALAEVEGGTYVEADTRTLASFLIEEWMPSRQIRGTTAGRGSRGQLGASTWRAYAD